LLYPLSYRGLGGHPSLPEPDAPATGSGRGWGPAGRAEPFGRKIRIWRLSSAGLGRRYHRRPQFTQGMPFTEWTAPPWGPVVGLVTPDEEGDDLRAVCRGPGLG
jgi:hypothetical protein